MTLSAPQYQAAPMLGVPAQRGRGVAILVLTGLITVQALATATGVLTNQLFGGRSGLAFTVDPSQGLGILGVVAWLVLAPWMVTAASGAAANGYPLTYRPWVAWWGWVIPIWNLWAPYRYMKDAAQGFAVRFLGLWWATWLLGTITLWSSGRSSTVDGVVTETSTSSLPFNAIALTISWFLFARIVWAVSQGSDGNTTSGPHDAGPIPWLPR